VRDGAEFWSPVDMGVGVGRDGDETRLGHDAGGKVSDMLTCIIM